MVKHGLDNDAVDAKADTLGIPRSERPMSDKSIDRLIDAIESPEDASGQIIPPKKGTPEYDALPSGVERSKARAYWDKQPEPEQESLAEALGAPKQ
jgi:hypothetical protein